MNKIIGKNDLGGLLRKYVDIGDKKELNQQIEKDFGALTKESHNALIASVESFKKDLSDGEKEAGEALSDAQANLSTTLSTNLFSQSQELLKLDVTDAFPNLELDDGLINSWGEFADALQSVADSLDLVKDAEKQWNDSGRISTKTILELLQQNANYADILDTSGKKIKLKANAEKLAAQVQIETIKASIDDTIATDQNTLAKNDAEIASIDNAIATAESTNTMIKEHPVLGKIAKQAGIATKALAALAYTQTSLANKSFSWDEFKKIWSNDYNVTTDDIGNNYIDTTVLQNRKSQLGKENAGIKKRDEVLAKIKENGIDLDDIEKDFGGKDTSSDKDTVLDIANAKLNLIDKEYEAQQAMSRAKTFEDGKNTLYYKKEREALLEKKDALATMIAQGGKASEILGYYKDIQDVEVSLNKLEQERLSDLESWAGEKHTSHERNKEILTAEIKNAKTYEDKLAAQKKLRDEKKSEEEDYLTLLQNELDSNKRLQSYLNPDSAEFDTYTNKMVKNYQDMAKASEDYLNNVLMVQYINDHRTEINPATGKN